MAYQIDAHGLPIPTTGQDFVTGVDNVGGAVVDPVTGDVLFSAFADGNRIYSISGFVAPAPEPGTMLLFAVGLAAAALIRRRKA